MKRTIFGILMATVALIMTALPAFADAMIYDNGFYAVVKTKEGYVNFRTEPSAQEKIICRINDGTVLFVMTQKNGWGLTVYDGKQGWVALSEVQKVNEEPEEAGYNVYVKANDGVNLRSGPGVDNIIICNISKGTELYVEETLNGWGHISYSGKVGWISLSETTTTPPSNDEPVRAEEKVKDIPDEDVKEETVTEEQKTQVPDEKNSEQETVNNTDVQNVKASMFNQIILIAAVVLLIIVIAVLLIIIVNLKSKR